MAPVKRKEDMRQQVTDIADIHLGYQFRKGLEPTDDGTHWVIQIRNFDENLILKKESLFRVRLDKTIEQSLIKKGDVLFLSRGHKNWAAPISDNLHDTVAVSHFFILKIRSNEVMPEYLAWYINQATAQEYLHSNARRGTHMPLIPMSAFKGLIVEVPAKEIQEKIVELSRLMEKEKRLLNELQEKRALFINAVCLNASKGKKEIM
jgi:restriction endonuclease S subunit